MHEPPHKIHFSLQKKKGAVYYSYLHAKFFNTFSFCFIDSLFILFMYFINPSILETNK